MNLHTPERQARESQADYRARRAASNSAVRDLKRGPHQAPAISPLDVSRFFLGQHTNPLRNKSRRALRLAKFARSAWLSHWTPTPTVKVRKHKPSTNPTPRDGFGAFTLIGKGNAQHERRKWLGGISAQRGF